METGEYLIRNGIGLLGSLIAGVGEVLKSGMNLMRPVINLVEEAIRD
jgi:hypothetical protein